MTATQRDAGGSLNAMWPWKPTPPNVAATGPRRAISSADRSSASGDGKDHVLRWRAEVGIDEIEERAVEPALEVERVIDRQRAPLPVEPLVHAEERDVVERQARLVDLARQDRVLARGTERQDQRDLLAAAPWLRDLREHVLGEALVQLLPGLGQGERHRRRRHQLVGGDGEPLAEAVEIERHEQPPMAASSEGREGLDVPGGHSQPRRLPVWTSQKMPTTETASWRIQRVFGFMLPSL